MRQERKNASVFGRIRFKVHRIHLARGVQQAVRVFMYSLGKYLSQVQKQLGCGPFHQGVQSGGKPRTG